MMVKPETGVVFRAVDSKVFGRFPVENGRRAKVVCFVGQANRIFRPCAAPIGQPRSGAGVKNQGLFFVHFNRGI